MSWFEATNGWTASLAKTAKTALKHAQKNIDKVLEIPAEQQETDSEASNESHSTNSKTTIKGETDNFFGIFGVGEPWSQGKSNGQTSLKESGSSNSLHIESSSKTFSLGIPSNRKTASSSSLSKLGTKASGDFSFAQNGQDFVNLENTVTTFEDVDHHSMVSFSAHKSSDHVFDVEFGIRDDDANDSLPEKVSHGRLEIVFQDDDIAEDNKLVEVPLGPSDVDIPTAYSSYSPDETDETEVQKVEDLVMSLPVESSPFGGSQVVEEGDLFAETADVFTGSDPIESVDFVRDVKIVAVETRNSLEDMESLQARLEMREIKLMEMSRHNATLKEEIDNLTSQLVDFGLVNSKLETLLQENSVLEKKLQTSAEEKKSLSEQLHLTKTELTNSLKSRPETSVSQVKELQNLLEEKEVVVKELMEEGEKLSKQQLQTSNHIKKMKTKQKELEAENIQLKSDLDGKTSEIVDLKATLVLAEETDQKHVASIQQLVTTVDTLEKDLLSTRSQLEETKMKSSTMQSALDAAYKDLADLHRQRAHQEGQSHETLLTVELAAKEELRQALEQQKLDLIHEQQDLTDRVEGLQTSLTRVENTLKRREDSHREEISDCQQRLQDAMTRNEELSQNLTQATRPLLRQNESLQQQLSEQNATFNKLELSLTKRLQESVAQLASAQEKERIASDKLTGLLAKVESLETQLSHLREERSSATAEADMERRRTREGEEKLSLLRAEIQTLRDSTTSELSSLRREKILFDHQLALEKEQLEMEKRKSSVLVDQINELQKQFSRKEQLPQTFSETALHRSDSVVSTASTMDGRWSPPAQNSNSSLYDVLRGGSSTFLDSLQSQLNMKEGEINHLRSELKHLEVSRQKMSEELLRAAERSHQMDQLKIQLENIEKEKEDVFKRYNAMLQIYGEKAEELQELRMDYDDMKSLYKAQIDALTRQKHPSI